MSTTDETYNGWKNRETWALNLWLTNDQGLYETTRERVAENIAEADEDTAIRSTDTFNRYRIRLAGETVKNLWEELTDPDEGLMTPENILVMVKDVGSDYRVDWDEIGEFWLSDAQEAD